jgi:hypothetical protein
VLAIDDRLRSKGDGTVAPLVFLPDLPSPIVHLPHRCSSGVPATPALKPWVDSCMTVAPVGLDTKAVLSAWRGGHAGCLRDLIGGRERLFLMPGWQI